MSYFLVIRLRHFFNFDTLRQTDGQTDQQLYLYSSDGAKKCISDFLITKRKSSSLCIDQNIFNDEVDNFTFPRGSYGRLKYPLRQNAN